MKIISTNATKEQQEQDMPQLLEMHAKALRLDPTWAFFGGTLTIGDRNYQVA